MNTPFCDHHIASFFSFYSPGRGPLDFALSNYFKNHKSLGSHDRRVIGEAVYGMVRWKTLLDTLCPDASPLERYRFFKNLDHSIFSDVSIPEPVRFGVPKFLLDSLVQDFGRIRAKELSFILNSPAPTTIRANLLKTTRDDLLLKFAELQPTPCPIAPHGIRFPKRLPLFSLPEFKEGLFEVQDEGSQVVSSLIKALPGESVLDFCSGSGGKTLAIAPDMQGKGQIYLHDIREGVLLEAKKRLRRAGVQNAQFLPPGHKQLLRIKEKCDWVLIDVPCSGTGTLRRNPDQKWSLDADLVERLVKTQRMIAKEAIQYLKPNGHLVYITCSILSEENERQVEFFLSNLPLSLEGSPLFLPPVSGGMDGFFAAVFKKIPLAVMI